MKKRSRTGLWLSLSTLLFVGVLALFAYIGGGTTRAIAATLEPLDFDNSCLKCHVLPLPDITWYCHNIIPAENYNSRMYLGEHLDWLVPYVTVPPNLYMPLATQLPANETQIHIFEVKLFPAFIDITIGTKVTWTNLDIKDHTLISSTTTPQGPFESFALKPGESASYTFDQAGVYNYIDQYVVYIPGVTPVYQQGYGTIVVAPPE